MKKKGKDRFDISTAGIFNSGVERKKKKERKKERKREGEKERERQREREGGVKDPGWKDR